MTTLSTSHSLFNFPLHIFTAGRMKRAVDAIEIDYPASPNSNHSIPLYKLYESFNNSDERIENITPEPLLNIVTLVDDSQETNGDKNVQKSIDSNSTGKWHKTHWYLHYLPTWVCLFYRNNRILTLVKFYLKFRT